MKKYKTETEVNEEILNKLQGQDRENFKKGLKNLGKGDPDLRAAFKRLRPNATDRELDVMADPDKHEVDKNPDEWIK